jgi:hypothetical protein
MLWLIAGLLALIVFLMFLLLLEQSASKDVLVKIINHLEGRRQSGSLSEPSSHSRMFVEQSLGPKNKK